MTFTSRMAKTLRSSDQDRLEIGLMWKCLLDVGSEALCYFCLYALPVAIMEPVQWVRLQYKYTSQWKKPLSLSLIDIILVVWVNGSTFHELVYYYLIWYALKQKCCHLMKFATFGAANNENSINMTFPFQCVHNSWINYFSILMLPSNFKFIPHLDISAEWSTLVTF